MNRPGIALLGAVLLVASAAVAAAFWPPGDARALANLGLLVVAGALFVVGGARHTVTVGGRRLPWYVFVGAGHLVFGAGLVAAQAPALGESATTVERIGALAAVVGGLVLAFIGVDYLRGGRHFAVADGDDGGR
ncbi:MAG: hypothetical protein ABEJ70_00980 [Halobacteriaceae archaeon]